MAPRVKKPQQPLTPEELYQQQLKGEFDRRSIHTKERFMPDPTFILNVGDEVILGALKDVRVEEVLDGGKWYHLSYLDKGYQYGQPYDNGRAPRVYPWFNLVPMAGIDRTTNVASGIKHDNWSSADASSMLSRVYGSGVCTDPEYQRGYVWTLEDKQKLIHSMMQRYDIGKMVFIKRNYSDTRKELYEILDGKQRLNAMQEFYEGRFTYQGYTFHQMSGTDRRAFEECRVQYLDISEDHATRADKLYIFLSVNIAGVPQSEEHMAYIRRELDMELAKRKNNE